MYFAFLAIFSGTGQIFGVCLYLHFWEFCLLELIKEIKRNSFMPLSTHSNAFQIPKNWSVNLMTLFVLNCSSLWVTNTITN